MWFCYERNINGNWYPCAYHKEEPTDGITKIERSTIYEIPADCVDKYGNADFAKLQRQFPPPVPEIHKDENVLILTGNENGN